MTKIIDWDDWIGRHLRLRDLHVFFAVAKEGSMAKAAQRLGVTQPAVSKVIADLEDTLSVRLLDRGPRGVEATIFGQALLKRGSAAFDELKQSVRDMQSLADPTTGELRIGCSEAIAISILSPILQQFARKYPRVVMYVSAVPPLPDRKQDFLLGRFMKPLTSDPLWDDFNVEFLFEDPLVVTTDKQSPWARRRRVDPAELIDEPWILSEPDTWNYTCVAEAFKSRGLDMPKVVLMARSVDLRLHFLAGGRFIAAFANSVARMHTDRYALKVLPMDWTVRSSSIAIITLKHRTLNPVAARFIEDLRNFTRPMRDVARVDRP